MLIVKQGHAAETLRRVRLSAVGIAVWCGTSLPSGGGLKAFDARVFKSSPCVKPERLVLLLKAV